MIMFIAGLSILAATASFPEATRAAVKPSAPFSENMVLQRDIPTPVWGTASPGETVTVSLAGQSKTAQTDATGKWMVKLDALPAGGPFQMKINDLTLQNVLVGEVWLASGQSNMDFRVSKAQNAEAEVVAANFPAIREFTAKKVSTSEPQSETAGQWKVCSPESVGNFSAVAYFFARELHQTLKVPVGIVHASRSATPAEAWTSRSALDAQPALKKRIDFWDQRVADYPKERLKYETEALPAWRTESDKAKAEGKPAPPEPKEPRGFAGDFNIPSSLFNGMINPLIPYGIRGVIWYQGEANVLRAGEYQTLFPTLIRDWRTRWEVSDLPFLWVQLANNGSKQTMPSEGGWAALREAQVMALALPNTAMAVIADTSADGGLHPREKQPIGHRLALAALARVYGQNLEFSGPLYDSMVVEGNAIRLKFTHIGGGLEAKNGKLEGFAIAGADKRWVWADAKIDGDTVIVSSPDITQPLAVRYAWASNPLISLFNQAGLPASPFRTDTGEK